MAKRVGRTRTFGISVDADTEKFLRAEADERFGGNVSKLVTALAREEQSRRAAEWLLVRSKNYVRMTDDEARRFMSRFDEPKTPRRKRVA